jgi:peptidoglycan/LPS O-acetylase OafA/YrhL
MKIRGQSLHRRRGSRNVRSLEAAYDGRDNSLGFLRLVFASSVVVAHAWPTSGNGFDPLTGWSDGQEGLGGIGVAGFFVISGFLVTRSARRLSLPRYVWHRILRIFPGFLCCLAFTAFVLAPLLWLYEHHSLSGFVSHEHGPVGYVTSNALLGMSQWDVSGLPEAVPYQSISGQPVFDGPLWTLQYEFMCYLLIALLAIVGLRTRGTWLLPPLLAGAWLSVVVLNPQGDATDFDYYGPVPVVGGWLNPFYVVQFLLLFLAGATAAAHARRVPVSDRLAAVCAVVVATTLAFGDYRIAGYVALAYLVLWAGVWLPEWTRRINVRRDYSYGIYIYAFVMQQTLAELGVRNILVNIGATFALTVPLAAASWHVVESKSLALKGLRLARQPDEKVVSEQAAAL